MDTSLIAAASQSIGVLKTLFDGVVATRDVSKFSEIRGAILDTQDRTLALQAQTLALIRTNHELEEKLRDLEAAARKREGRDLYEVRPGAFVYASKPAVGQVHAPPYWCQACEGKGVESVLRWFHGSYKDSWDCPNSSEHEITVDTRPRPQRAVISPGPFVG